MSLVKSKHLVLGGILIVCILALTCVLAACGATKSEPIVGHWNSEYRYSMSNPQQTEYDFGWSAEGKADGTFTYGDRGITPNYCSWKAVPQKDWQVSGGAGAETVGEYEITITGLPLDCYAVVAKNNGKTELYLFIGRPSNASVIVFEKSS